MLSMLITSAFKNARLSQHSFQNIYRITKQTECNNFIKVCSVTYATIPSNKTKQAKEYASDNDKILLSSWLKARKNLRKKKDLFFQRHSAQAYVNKAPETIKPYLQLIRADKPIGTLLLYLPCAFSICFAAAPGELPDFYYLGLFGIGAFLMRGAGCIINDLWDQDIDKRVERTKNRPLASGAVSRNNALKLLFGHLSLSLGILLSLNTTCIAIGFASMIPVIVYPLAKRYTNFPQVVLGLTFNIGAIMGYAAVTGTIDWNVVGPLYGSCIAWTVYYDSIYAFQDVNDDQEIGVGSIPVLFNNYSRNRLQEMDIKKRLEAGRKTDTKINVFLWLACSAHYGLFALAGISSGSPQFFYLALVIVFFRTFDEINKLQLSSKGSCWKAFDSTKWQGLILLIGIISSNLLK